MTIKKYYMQRRNKSYKIYSKTLGIFTNFLAELSSRRLALLKLKQLKEI
jgi:hypothetical protein